MKKKVLVVLSIGVFLLGVATIAQAALVDVDAKINAYDSGFFDTNVVLSAGDWLSIIVAENDLWAAGPNDRTSNANGLTGISPYGGGNYGYYTNADGSFHYGSLVGYIGDGDYFFIGTNFNQQVTDAGKLFFGYWDSNSSDNVGYITVNINTSVVPIPAAVWLLGSGLLGLVGFRKNRSA